MAYTSGTYECGQCGHAGSVNFTGKNLDFRITSHFGGLCLDCERLERERELAEKSDNLNLQPLKGSDKQIKWATKIRLQMIQMLNQYDSSKPNVKEAYNWLTQQQTSAKWFIDKRSLERPLLSTVILIFR